MALILVATFLAAGPARPALAAQTDPGQSVVNPTPVASDELLGMVHVQSAQGLCSGSLIAADTVLTAAHCVCTLNWVGGNVCESSATVTFRPDPANPFATPRTLHGSATFHPDYNPSWTGQQIEHDYAVIKLDGVAPAYARPFIVAEGYATRHSDVLLAGFGHTGSDCSGPSGDPNKMVAKLDDYEDGHDIMRFDDQAICKGDSGGPVLDLDGTHVFGVHSMFAWTIDDGWVSKSDTTGSVFAWLKSFMCKSSTTNSCSGHGDVCSCTGRSDILWRGPHGEVAVWLMDGSSIVGESVPGAPDFSWQIQGSGDFDGDGNADILWRNTNGQVAIWFMQNGWIVGAAYPGGQDPYQFWKIQGVGDFDGDGRSDILWRDGYGQLAIWFQGDSQLAAFPGYSNYPYPVDNSWVVRGVGDFDGDGRSDILWRHVNGQVAIWSMDGGLRVGESYPGATDPSGFWTIQAVGDFDGNQHSDILWRGADGRLNIWFDGKEGSNGPNYQNSPPGPGDLSWQVVAVGDFDHDGRDEILWRHSSGQLAIWLMNGVRFVGDIYPRWADPSWKVQGLMHDALNK
jgi:hypothetical protein